jgi:TPR repeat protein
MRRLDLAKIGWAAGVAGWVGLAVALGWLHRPVWGSTPKVSLSAGMTALDLAHYDAARNIFSTLAKTGDAAAETRLARMDEHGLGAPPNGTAALALYRKAAEAGSAEAARRLGELYLRGTVVLQDVGKARHWLQSAAQRRDAPAERTLGELYAEGLGMPKDPVKAYAWLAIAASQGDGVAARERDSVLARLSPDQLAQGEALAQNDLRQQAVPGAAKPAVAKSAPPAAPAPG